VIQQFIDLANQLVEQPLLLALVLMLGTFVAEDSATLAAALLVSEGRVSYEVAFGALLVGILLSDMGLYALGRLVGPRVITWGLVSAERLEQATYWFQRNIIVAVLVTRCMPGLRMATYVASGIFRASLPKFALAVCFASVVWLVLVMWLGDQISKAAGRYRWWVLGGLILVLALVQFIVYLRRPRSTCAASQEQA
jgi:membrane protein DedA with SNARE-associated domain